MSNSLMVPTAHETQIIISPFELVAADSLRKIPIEYRKCIFQDENPLHFYQFVIFHLTLKTQIKVSVSSAEDTRPKIVSTNARQYGFVLCAAVPCIICHSFQIRLSCAENRMSAVSKRRLNHLQ